MLQCRRFRGITPALAGKSREIPLHLRAAKDHPRVGGEKQIGGDNGLDKQGSPPRGRGKVPRALKDTLSPWITPAWAGKRWSGPCRSARSEDHPRVGGEKANDATSISARKGSPPRGRGKVYAVVGDLHPFGITPAWAGKRAFLTTSVSMKRGSPPRGRGKDRGSEERHPQAGITPAWAGKSDALQRMAV